MLADRQSLTDEISRLEKELDSQHFRGLFDKRAQHQKEKRLKKLRRELAEQEGTAVTQMPFRKTESEESPKPVRQPKTVKAPAIKPATAAKAPRTPAKPAARPAGKPKAPPAKKKSQAKSKPAPRPRKKSK